jgi:hypothetical protein
MTVGWTIKMYRKRQGDEEGKEMEVHNRINERRKR